MGGAGVGMFEDLREASRMALVISERVEPVREHVEIYDRSYRQYLKIYEVLEQLKL